VTVSGSITTSSIVFEEGTVTLAGTATPILTISGVGGVTINNTIDGKTTFAASLGNVVLSLSQNWANNSSAAFDVASGVIASGASRTLTLNGSGTGGATFSGILGDGTGTLGITVNTTGGGVTTFSNTGSTYTGQLTVQSGTLKIDTANNASSNGELGNSANAVILGGSGSTGTLEYTGATASSSKKFTMATGGSGAFQIDSAATNLTLSGVIDGSGGLTKTGDGTLTLTGVNTYSGATTVNSGTLSVTGVGAGGKISTSSALVLGGGALNFSFSNNGVQTFNGVTVNSGSSSVTSSGGNAPNPYSLTLGSITRNIGGTVDFNPNSSGTQTTTTSNGSFTGGSQTILGGYATVGGNTWAVSGTGGTAGAITGLASYNAGFAAGTNVNATVGTTNPTAMTINSLRFNTAGAYTVNTSGNLTVATGGILETSTVGNNAVSINNNNLTSGNGKDLVVIQNNTAGGMTIGSTITNNGATSIGLTKSGAGSLALTSANTFTGVTTINAGTLNANGTSGNKALGGTTSVIVNGGGTLLTSTAQQFNAGSPPTMTLAGGTFNTNGTSQTLGALTLSDNSIIDLSTGTSDVLRFANSAAATWNTNISLTIQNWNGSLSGGGNDEIFFGTGSSGLTASEIAEVQFLNPGGFAAGTYGATILSTGEIVPIPEASTWISGLLGVTAVGYGAINRLRSRRSRR